MVIQTRRDKKDESYYTTSGDEISSMLIHQVRIENMEQKCSNFILRKADSVSGVYQKMSVSFSSFTLRSRQDQYT